MFTCPEKDIHSIYLDNELPAKYAADYEAHLQSCEKCRAQLQRLKQLRSLLSDNAKALEPNKEALDASFARLQSRLAFTKVTRYAEQKNTATPFTVIKWTIPAVAAAAILAFVVPLRLAKTPAATNTSTNVIAISRQQPTPITESNVIVNGNLPHKALASLFDTNTHQETNETPLTAQYASFSSTTTKQHNNTIRAALTGVDIFRPEFNDANALPLQIEVPHMAGILLIDTTDSTATTQK